VWGLGAKRKIVSEGKSISSPALQFKVGLPGAHGSHIANWQMTLSVARSGFDGLVGMAAPYPMEWLLNHAVSGQLVGGKTQTFLGENVPGCGAVRFLSLRVLLEIKSKFCRTGL
jgi:hypothetical protein